MKRKSLFICAVMLFAFVSCNNTKESAAGDINPSMKIEDDQNENIGATSVESTNKKIDYDWSKMNYNMLSSVIFDLQVNPEKYAGMRIKATGNFDTQIYEGNRYFSVLIWDSTGCCPTGFDFLPPADMKYPDDFPLIGDTITVTCVFNYNVVNGHDVLMFEAEDIIFE